jgi:hypothetical protein
MSYEANVRSITLLAGADFSTTGQHRFGKIGTDGKVELNGAAERAAGAIGNDPAEDQPLELQLGDVLEVEIGSGGLAAGDLVASGASGVAITQAATAIVLGHCLKGGVEGELGTILFQPQGAP